MSEKIDTIRFSSLERTIFNARTPIIVVYALITFFLAYRALFIQPDTRLERLVPNSHEFAHNSREFLGGLSAGGSSVVRLSVSNRAGESIFEYDFLAKLQAISDEVSLLDGVNTTSLNSLWAPQMLWFAVTPEGFDSGPVIDNERFENSSDAMAAIRSNAIRAGILGTYISNDLKSTLIDFAVIGRNPSTGEELDVNELADRIEEIRSKYQDESLSIHVIGDVKKLADLVEGFEQIVFFFAVAFAITALLLYNYSRCIRSTLIPLLCSIVAVIWQLGMLNLLGINLGVFSVLVPFLVFAIAVSHGVQMINAIAHESAGGADRLDAARNTFHHLYKPGLLALLSDGIGFAMLFVIDIGAIQDLALVASVGVAMVIFTNLILLPLLMSYVGVSQSCINHAQHKLDRKSLLWDTVGKFAQTDLAKIGLMALVVLAIFGFYMGLNLKIGDLDKGAPELRADSRYNLDNNHITSNYNTSTDLMAIFIGTLAEQCVSYKTVEMADRLEYVLMHTPGVQGTSGPGSTSRFNRYLGNEGNLKMMAIPRDERVLYRSVTTSGFSTMDSGYSDDCSQQRLMIELADHKQETLQRVTQVVRDFAVEHDDADIRFRLGTGNAANEAATNEVIESAQYRILAYVYAVVAVMCLFMFRSIRAVLCILIPLALTSILCQALMALLGIGVKVATLPVIALGVGIGVDYGIYIYSRLRSYLNLGHDLKTAYLETLKATGKAVSFTGMTLAVGVATWIFSPIKFQADMGILLTFMFLWNMVGALTLLPALAWLLLKPEQVSHPSLNPA